MDLRRLKPIAWAIAVAVTTLAGLAAVPETRLAVYESSTPPVPENAIDKLVFAGLKRAGLRPVLCSDAVFLRRVYLDVIGTLPTAEEARAFLADPDAGTKRRRLIDRLLAREEFADYWAMKWGDMLRIKAEFPVNLWPNAAQAYHRWVRASLAANKPYDQFARELLTSSGSNFRVGPVNFYRAVQNRTSEGLAAAAALAFLGVRIESWPAERRAGLAAFFSQVGYKPTSEWKEEHVFWDPLGAGAMPGNSAPGRAALAGIGPSTNKAAPPVAPAPSPAARAAIFPDGTRIELPEGRDPREVFADWLITSKNPWFARCAVNRLWFWLLGRGLVHEPDDFRPDNPPSQPALLARLEKELVASHYDMKRMCRLILNSQTYQMASTPRTAGTNGVAPLARYPVRRLEAEVIIDIINKITGTSDLYTSPIPEPFTYIPPDQTAVAIGDGSITSPFLALFGRSARATGLLGERDDKPLPAQWLHLLNSSHIQRKLERGPAMQGLLDAKLPPEKLIDALYLTILSRHPAPEEIRIIEAYGSIPSAKPSAATSGGKHGKPSPPAAPQRPVKKREDWLDVAWALMNSKEFLYRH